MHLSVDSVSEGADYPKGARIFLRVVLVAAFVIAIKEGIRQTAGGDFAVFWRAGGNFAGGYDLYGGGVGERLLIYPPFAALLFQPLSLLPLVPAAVLFSIASVLCAVCCYRLTTTILEVTFPGRRIHWWPLVGAVLFSHSYILNNLTMVQVNLFVLLVVLFGFLRFARGQPALAAFVFAVAAGFKVMPVILVAWALVRAPRTAWRGVLAGATVAILLPFLWRGPARGVQDLRDYNTAFLSAFQSGRVVADYTNQNLASAIFRATQPASNREGLDYQVIDLAPSTTRLMTLLALASVVLAFGSATLLRGWRGMEIHSVELVGALLAWHLISGITWKAHLVSFLFIYAFFLSVPRESLPIGPRRLWQMVVSLLAVFAFVGRDIVGRTAHFYLGGYSYLTVLMVLMFALAIWMMVARQVVPAREAPAAKARMQA